MLRKTLTVLPGIGLLAVLGACIARDTLPPTPPIEAEVVVRVLPQLREDLANTLASTRLAEVQYTIHDDNTLELINEGVVDIDPSQPGLEPSVEIVLTLTRRSDVDIKGQIWLLGDDETIEWSGLFGPVNVDDDPDVEAWEVEIEMGRGDLPNMTVEGIELPGPGGELTVGQNVTLPPDVQGGPSPPTLFWGSSSPGVATVNQQGQVSAVGPGETTISVASGLHVGTAVVTVVEG